MGKSKPWPFALEQMTGSKEMSVAPIKEYFRPLQEWLVKERCNKGYHIGWPGQPGKETEGCLTSASTFFHGSWLGVMMLSILSKIFH